MKLKKCGRCTREYARGSEHICLEGNGKRADEESIPGAALRTGQDAAEFFKNFCDDLQSLDDAGQRKLKRLAKKG